MTQTDDAEITFSIADGETLHHDNEKLWQVTDILDQADLSPEDRALLAQTILDAVHGDGLDEEAIEA